MPLVTNIITDSIRAKLTYRLVWGGKERKRRGRNEHERKGKTKLVYKKVNNDRH